jgi:hypothetical protein
VQCGRTPEEVTILLLIGASLPIRCRDSPVQPLPRLQPGSGRALWLPPLFTMTSNPTDLPSLPTAVTGFDVPLVNCSYLNRVRLTDTHRGAEIPIPHSSRLDHGERYVWQGASSCAIDCDHHSCPLPTGADMSLSMRSRIVPLVRIAIESDRQRGRPWRYLQ